MGGIKRSQIAAQDARRRPTCLGDLTRQEVDVFCWCNRCSHNAILETEMLAARLGPTMPVPDIGIHLRCQNCGSKDVAARPAWPSLGQVARHD